jgi:MinD superfamily P-loop ATPase
MLVDADMDAANLELVLAPTRLKEPGFMGGQVAVIDPDQRGLCGCCYEGGRFDDIVYDGVGTDNECYHEGRI